MSYDGVAKLIDFGIAKASTSTLRTQTGGLKGKIAYMSPEQASGNPLDRRSDVFSLGIVLWEMIVGRRLHKGDNDLATIQKIIHVAPPSLRAYRRDCPRELEQIVARCLALDPDARTPTAQALQVELEELARELRLTLSTVQLRATLHGLFADELDTWREAQRETPTVTDARPIPSFLHVEDEVEDDDDADGERADPPARLSTELPVADASMLTSTTAVTGLGRSRRPWWKVAAVAALLIGGAALSLAIAFTNEDAGSPAATAEPPRAFAAPSVPVAVPEPAAAGPAPIQADEDSITATAIVESTDGGSTGGGSPGVDTSADKLVRVGKPSVRVKPARAEQRPSRVVRSNARKKTTPPAKSSARAPRAPVKPTPRPWYSDRLGGALVLAGVASAGVGAGFVTWSYATESDAAKADLRDDAIKRLDEATLQRRLGVVGLGLGAVLISAGIMRYVTRDGGDARVALTLFPTSVGVHTRF